MTPFMEAKLTTSYGNIPFIPLHVIEEILLRLDVQILFQCAFICRDWNALITSSDFISHSSKRTFDSRNQILLIRESAETRGSSSLSLSSRLSCCQPTYSLHWDNDQFDLLRTIKNPPVDDFKGTRLIGVSNGLVCLATKNPPKFILWNPTVRKYAWFPFMMTWDEAILSAEGFGFDCSSNDFKIVSLLYRQPDPFRFIIEVDSAWIFSYVSWSWKRLTIPSSWFAYRDEPPVLLNGVLYWRAYHEEEGSDDYDFILTFNLTHEVFGRILFPSDARLMGKNSLVTTGDSLLLIQETYEWHFDESDEETDEDEQVSNQFTIWITKGIDNHESWMNIFSITSEMDPDHILGARKNGDLILYMDGGQILRFNPTTPTNLLVGAIEKSVSFRYHNESLCLLEKGEGVHSY